MNRSTVAIGVLSSTLGAVAGSSAVAGRWTLAITAAAAWTLLLAVVGVRYWSLR